MSSKANLQGLPILLTRPQRHAEEWRTTLTDLGADVVHIPTLAIMPLPVPNSLSKDLQAAHIGVFVSGNAVRALAAHDGAMEYPVRWYCVGPTTRELARSLGFTVAESAAVDSESLLQHPDLQSLSGQCCIIVRGQGGRETLGKTLLARGAQVNYCEMYRRDCASENVAALADYLRLLPAAQPHVISAASVDTLNYTLSLAEQGEQAAAVMQSTLLVPSERVASAARERGVQRVLQAPSMQLADIVYILNKWWAEER